MMVSASNSEMALLTEENSPLGDYLQRLIENPEGIDPLEKLAALADIFGGDAAGLEIPMLVSQVWPANTRLAFPWQEKNEILNLLEGSLSGISLPGEEESTWLLVPAGPVEGSLVWLHRRGALDWTEKEKGAFYLAGNMLGRQALLANNSCEKIRKKIRWQKNLDHTTHLTGRLTHEFSNILTGILGFAELSLTRVPPDSPGYRYLQEVWQAAQHGAEWLNKLQTFSRRTRLPRGTTDLAAVVDAQAGRIRNTGKITFHLNIPDDLPPVAMDAEALHQVIAQILDNAVEAIPGAGVVCLSARIHDLSGEEVLDLLGQVAPGRHVEVTITDTGTGFHPDLRQRLLQEIFFTTKTRRRGLGLAVVYGFLQTFRGGLTFDNGPENGAAVRIYLPLAPSHENPIMSRCTRRRTLCLP